MSKVEGRGHGRAMAACAVGLGAALAASPAMASTPVWRLYNPYSGEHLFTTDASERASLPGLGWSDEGEAWSAPDSGEDVWRLYNPYSGDHLYTASAAEYARLQAVGWSGEGVALESGGARAIYRLYNPWLAAGTHLYTTDSSEYAALSSAGWSGEGRALMGEAEGASSPSPSSTPSGSSSSAPGSGSAGSQAASGWDEVVTTPARRVAETRGDLSPYIFKLSEALGRTSWTNPSDFYWHDWLTGEDVLEPAGTTAYLDGEDVYMWDTCEVLVWREAEADALAAKAAFEKQGWWPTGSIDSLGKDPISSVTAKSRQEMVRLGQAEAAKVFARGETIRVWDWGSRSEVAYSDSASYAAGDTDEDAIARAEEALGFTTANYTRVLDGNKGVVLEYPATTRTVHHDS